MSKTRSYGTECGALEFEASLRRAPGFLFNSPELIKAQFDNSIVHNCNNMQKEITRLDEFLKNLPENNAENKSEELESSFYELCRVINTCQLPKHQETFQEALALFKTNINLLRNELKKTQKMADAEHLGVRRAGVFGGCVLGGAMFGVIGAVGGILGTAGVFSGRRCVSPDLATKESWLQRGTELGEKIIAAVEAKLPKQKPVIESPMWR